MEVEHSYFPTSHCYEQHQNYTVGSNEDAVEAWVRSLCAAGWEQEDSVAAGVEDNGVAAVAAVGVLEQPLENPPNTSLLIVLVLPSRIVT